MYLSPSCVSTALPGLLVVEFPRLIVNLRSGASGAAWEFMASMPAMDLTQMENLNYGKLNTTRVTEFILLGFPGSPHFQLSIFIIFLIIYLLTILGNLAIILLIIIYQHLHTPMYIFLYNLALLEMWFTTASIPKILAILLGGSRSISFSCCILQLYFIFSFGCTEQLLLAVMAYDRYLAICYPLHYSTIMTINLSCKIALGCWLGSFLLICIPTYMVTTLTFCGPNVINNFYCNLDSWIILSCTDTRFIELTFFSMAVIVVIGSCMITLLSYMYIISTILRIPSTKGRQKAFSTCSSHLAVVIIWYGSTMFLFVKPSKEISLEKNKLVSVFNVILVPLLNPFIYTLRNKDIRDVLKNIFHR
ncbi:olfactory receptor 6F1-like [Pantherophis guttatus]|uniref:Olfactory receptor n=1 Tax=Pantherophis guttatus TaxID=94885 RepID=A0A6P9C847_PANGU|nr:olfactory receptor 6F1-like [Pantherophis guttatus]